jgi:hypothetical protein
MTDNRWFCQVLEDSKKRRKCWQKLKSKYWRKGGREGEEEEQEEEGVFIAAKALNIVFQ